MQTRNIKTSMSLLLLFLLPLLWVPAFAQSPITLHRGVNTFPWLYRGRMVEGKPGVYALENSFPLAYHFTPEKLQELRRIGLDFVRIPIDPTPFLNVTPEGRKSLIAQVLAAVKMANAAGLTVIVDFHPRESIPEWGAAAIMSSEKKKSTYREVLVEAASALVAAKDARAVLEVMNEPTGGYGSADAHDWQDLQKEYVKAIRHVAHDLPLIVTGARGGGIEGLVRLDPSEIKDRNLFYSFHYYDPMVVTHQGATWTQKKYRPYLVGVPYPPTRQSEDETVLRVQANIAKGISDPVEAKKASKEVEEQLRSYFESKQGKEKVEDDFRLVLQWAQEQGIPPSRILLGEFGIFRPGASAETAARYLKDVRTTAERAGFSWAFFNYQPGESLPSFTMLHQVGEKLDGFDPDIVEEGLGLTLPRQP